MPEACLHCGGRLELALDLGAIPLVDALCDAADAALRAPRHPLRLHRCFACALVQLDATPAPETLFPTDYPYASSVSSGVVASARAHAERLIIEQALDAQSLVVEAACNDGYQLRWFAEAGIPVFGIEPVAPLAERCRALGIPCAHAFFDADWAAQWQAGIGRTDVFLAKNVLAHVPDPVGFLRGVGRLLRPGGIACFEFPYLGDMVEQGQFDTIYHEHRCYFSVTSAHALMQTAGLHVQKVESIPLHGGSLRIEAGLSPGDDADVARWMERETESGLNTLAALEPMGGKVAELRRALPERIATLRAEGARVAAYAAAAKGVVMLEACGLGCDDLAFVVDRNPAKQGRFMPGSGLPIVDASRLEAADVLLLLAWNHAEEILAQQRAFTARGGRWIVPLPRMRELGEMSADSAGENGPD